MTTFGSNFSPTLSGKPGPVFCRCSQDSSFAVALPYKRLQSIAAKSEGENTAASALVAFIRARANADLAGVGLEMSNKLPFVVLPRAPSRFASSSFVENSHPLKTNEKRGRPPSTPRTKRKASDAAAANCPSCARLRGARRYQGAFLRTSPFTLVHAQTYCTTYALTYPRSLRCYPRRAPPAARWSVRSSNFSQSSRFLRRKKEALCASRQPPPSHTFWGAKRSAKTSTQRPRLSKSALRNFRPKNSPPVPAKPRARLFFRGRLFFFLVAFFL